MQWGGFASTVFIPGYSVPDRDAGMAQAFLVLAAGKMIVCGGPYFRAIVATMNVMTSLVRLGAAMLRQRAATTGQCWSPCSWGALVLCAGFWFAVCKYTKLTLSGLFVRLMRPTCGLHAMIVVSFRDGRQLIIRMFN